MMLKWQLVRILIVLLAMVNA
jgi:hypothetical protein